MTIKDSDLPKVSFIIPTLNAAWILPKCLEAIRGQTYPQDKVEIIVADGGSTDQTTSVAAKFGALVVANPEILHEPGKTRALEKANGEIYFFTDADNILSSPDWLRFMVKPYQENKNIVGFLPQTIPAPDSNSLDRYLGYLSTDPFTWFVYQEWSTPRTYKNKEEIYKRQEDYFIYKFRITDHPLMGTSQGFGLHASFKKEGEGRSDDILTAIKLVESGGLVLYAPKAGVYHYHVKGVGDFIRKYSWRVRNNLTQKVKGMGLVNRQKYLNLSRRIRQILFIPYSLSLIFPIIDTIKLLRFYRDIVFLWHPFACLTLSLVILKEGFLFLTGFSKQVGTYGK